MNEVKFYTFDKNVKTYDDKVKFKKEKFFALELNENRLLVSAPSIQPWHEIKFDNINDAMYFYYDTEIDAKYFEDDDEDEKHPKWAKLIQRNTYEFASLVQLENAIDYIIKYDLKNDVGRREYYYEDPENKILSETDYESVYEYDFGSMCNEDVYHFTKHYFHRTEYGYGQEAQKDDELTYYDLFIGISTAFENNITGFKVLKLKENDLYIIKEWCKSFLDYAVQIERKHTQSIVDKIVDENYEFGEYEDHYEDYRFIYKHIKEKYPEDLADWTQIVAKIENTHNMKKYIDNIKQGIFPIGQKDYEYFIEKGV